MTDFSYKPYVAICKGGFLHQFYPQANRFQNIDNPAIHQAGFPTNLQEILWKNLAIPRLNESDDCPTLPSAGEAIHQ
jgi:hypothetical protein